MTQTSTPAARYAAGQTVEVQVHNFGAPGMPLEWVRADVLSIDALDGGLSDVTFRRTGAGAPTAEVIRVGKRGGGKRIRPVT